MRLIRWTPPALMVVVVVVWLPSLAVSISQYDGSYTGTLACDQIPGHTSGPLKVAFFLTINGARAEYERWHVRPPAGLDFTERGSGTVSSTGEVSLMCENCGVAYQATYRGRVDGKHLHLSGIQVWQFPDKGDYQRPCAIAVSRPE